MGGGTVRTDNDAKFAKPKAATYEMPDASGRAPGLALRVAASGRKTWTLRYRNRQGQQRRLTLGTYPALGVSVARERGAAELGRISGGADPAKDRQAARAKATGPALDTVNRLVEGFLEAAEKGRHRPNSRPLRASTLAQYRAYHALHIEGSRFGKRPAREVTRTEVRELVESIADDHSPTAARMCGGLLRAAFNFGIRREAVDKNPAALIEIPRSGKRERVLTDKELRGLWRGAEKPAEGIRVSPLMGAAIRLAMVTLQRGGEVCGIREDEIDEKAKLWTIPGERTKNHLTHAVPLSPLALDIIRQARKLRGKNEREYLFPSPQGGAITRHALSRAVARIRSDAEIENATLHDTRRTGATNITGERIGMPRFIVSRVLNQISDTGGAAAVTGVYDRNEYLAEKRKALEAWAGLMGRIV